MVNHSLSNGHYYNFEFKKYTFGHKSKDAIHNAHCARDAPAVMHNATVNHFLVTATIHLSLEPATYTTQGVIARGTPLRCHTF